MNGKMSLLLSIILIGLFAASSAKEASVEEKLQAFIDSHVKQVEPKFKAMNLANWNAMSTGEKKYYDDMAALDLEIRTIYSNPKDYAVLKQWKESGQVQNPLLQRQLIVLINGYLVNQMKPELRQKIVAQSARIGERFNTFRGTIDEKEVSDNEISSVLRSETDSAKRRRAWEAGKQVGQAVAPLVLDLVKLRNQGARELGFDNFYTMSLAAAEQNESDVLAVFDELKRLSDEPFRKLKKSLDDALAEKYGIKAEDMRPWHYQDPFFQEAPAVGKIDLDKFFAGKKVDEIARAFYDGIGLPVDDILKNSDIHGRPGKYQHAFSTDIDRLGDIRTILSVTDNHYWMGTLLHELGHGVFSKNIRPDLPYLLRSEAHAFLTEAIAQLMERQADNADWLEAMVGIGEKDKEAVRAAIQKNLRLRELIFCRWSQVMVRFERSLYQNPNQDLNKLWWDLVEECQLVKRPDGRNEPDWAAKIHLAQYPAYYHNYMLGELAAYQIQDAIARDVFQQPALTEVSFVGKPEVGRFLKEKIFAPGMSLAWNDLLKEATGETLTPKAFAEKFFTDPKDSPPGIEE